MINDSDIIEAELTEILGGTVQALETSPDEIDVASVLQHVRSLLANAAETDGIGVNQLARRLGVSPPAVSRMCRSDGDMRVSTLVLWAKALGREWHINLEKLSADCHHSNAGQNYSGVVIEKLSMTEPQCAVGAETFVVFVNNA